MEAYQTYDYDRRIAKAKDEGANASNGSQYGHQQLKYTPEQQLNDELLESPSDAGAVIWH